MQLNSFLKKQVTNINIKFNKNIRLNEKDYSCILRVKRLSRIADKPLESDSIIHELVQNIITSTINLTLSYEEICKIIVAICSHKAYSFHLEDLKNKNDNLYKFIKKNAKSHTYQFLLQYDQLNRFNEATEKHFNDFVFNRVANQPSVSEVNETPSVLDCGNAENEDSGAFTASVHLYYNDHNKQKIFFLTKPCELSIMNGCKPFSASEVEMNPS